METHNTTRFKERWKSWGIFKISESSFQKALWKSRVKHLTSLQLETKQVWRIWRSLLIKAWWKLHLEQILKTDFHSSYLSFVFSNVEPWIIILYIFDLIWYACILHVQDRNRIPIFFIISKLHAWLPSFQLTYVFVVRTLLNWMYQIFSKVNHALFYIWFNLRFNKKREENNSALFWSFYLYLSAHIFIVTDLCPQDGSAGR